ncbi:hypothetical protein BsWGS_07016 [Bradybaena similaris]
MSNETIIALVVVQISLIGICFAAASDSSSNCPINFTDEGGYCYNYTDVPMSWDNALAYCSQNNGRLMIESTPDEHVVFVNYRQKLPTQGDPMWEGIYVNNSLWRWNYDQGLTSPLYSNWLGGSNPPVTQGNCAATSEVNSTEKWQPVKCSTSLHFVCEASSKNPPTGGYNYTTSRYKHGWKKVYLNSIYQRANVVVNANMARIRSLVSCAVACSTVSGCAAFNHRPSDNTCQFILSQVTDKTYVVDQAGWDVWLDFPPA